MKKYHIKSAMLFLISIAITACGDVDTTPSLSRSDAANICKSEAESAMRSVVSTETMNASDVINATRAGKSAMVMCMVRYGY